MHLFESELQKIKKNRSQLDLEYLLPRGLLGKVQNQVKSVKIVDQVTHKATHQLLSSQQVL